MSTFNMELRKANYGMVQLAIKIEHFEEKIFSTLLAATRTVNALSMIVIGATELYCMYESLASGIQAHSINGTYRASIVEHTWRNHRNEEYPIQTVSIIQKSPTRVVCRAGPVYSV